MKYTLLLAMFTFAIYGAEIDHKVAPVPEGDIPSAGEIFHPADNTDAGYWHCTAYAEGHGHSWGFSYRDVHYNHAYYGAIQTCEQSTGHHCHDVHCHYDWH